MSDRVLAVVLAAGESTRMKSSKSKVLHTIGNLPMISHVMSALEKTGVSDVALVVGRDADPVISAARSGKLNVAALGNVVSQLHVHVVARFKADAAWPAPVWGAVPVEKRPHAQSLALRAQLREALSHVLPMEPVL